ncbi:hypothetical protein LTR20_008188 [Exophiala xenobiotica]|nr:hypothetical protein LTR41_001121 [Exophiala xenobiotica]KAK5324272.1 hypothetical protein LTR93_005060 [Exophiala xenobiotica]KAK5383983.1 hypothetical protein LTS13_002175 [Exophiala xenobiotica]KAK5399697.1 hypothetical protein LTR79_003335 [Exophiala xenobiotica]KAK5410928.1 hypothetical protein LTR06_005817 [Exophiala xenobiotica]
MAISKDSLDWDDDHQPSPDRSGGDWRNASKRDAKYLRKQANLLKSRSHEIERLIVDQLQSQTSYRTTVLTILATIYIPLSFATGIFGMNIKEINDGTPRWWAVVAVGLPLVLLTIVVPLFFDSFYQASVTAAQSRTFKAAAFICGAIIFIILFVSEGTPFLGGYYLDTIPIGLLLLYALRKWYVFWNKQPKTEWRFYCFFFFYTLVVGAFNNYSYLSSDIALPFFLAILPMLGYWWKRDRVKAWWTLWIHERRRSRKSQQEARHARRQARRQADETRERRRLNDSPSNNDRSDRPAEQENEDRPAEHESEDMYCAG